MGSTFVDQLAGTFDAYTWAYILVVIAFLAALIAQARVKYTYSRFDKVMSRRGLTAEQAAAEVLRSYGIYDVEIRPIAGNLTDNFNPKTKIISLSEATYGHSSIAAIGVACHEAGHAAQHAQGYVPIKIRNAIIPVCNLGSRLGIPLALVGMFIPNDAGRLMIIIGLALYAFVALFQFATLPVELDASHRALKVINETQILTDDERKGARQVLVAAAMTYVVAIATALADLFRMIVLLNGRKD
ncbi:MAG: zinc metallopeptidase [Clostridia bacterium]|nr:zinc metallopeptidase [Clostridia bacterium]